MSALRAFSLRDKKVIVTGANTGIGQGICVSLAHAGAHVIGVGRSSMDETVALVQAAGGRMSAQKCDFLDAPQTTEVIDLIWKEYGPIDGLVNNAGIIRRENAVDHSVQDWDEVMQVNLTVPFKLAQSFARLVLAAGRPGKIVNIASLLSFQGGIRVPAYTASKHGVAGLTKALANEWAAKGINVNGIAPGYIITNNTEALREDKKRSAEILGRIPAGRWGEASDIGDSVTFLLAPASDYIHGTLISVDGGWMAR